MKDKEKEEREKTIRAEENYSSKLNDEELSALGLS